MPKLQEYLSYFLQTQDSNQCVVLATPTLGRAEAQHLPDKLKFLVKLTLRDMKCTVQVDGQRTEKFFLNK